MLAYPFDSVFLLLKNKLIKIRSVVPDDYRKVGAVGTSTLWQDGITVVTQDNLGVDDG
jgi:hypothetical protein